MAVQSGKVPPGAKTELARILPEQAPPYAAATPLLVHEGYFRRAYASGEKQIEITVARMGGEPGAYQRWVTGSVSYPQVELSLPAGEANGFFTCASDAIDAPCDLHIQLRRGVHVEVMGNGRVPRADLAKLIAQIPLTTLPATGFAGPSR